MTGTFLLTKDDKYTEREKGHLLGTQSLSQLCVNRKETDPLSSTV